jgi:hypothetical protein
MSFWTMVSLMIAMVAVLGVFVEIPVVSDYAFWVLVAAYVVWVGSHYNTSATKGDLRVSASLVIFIVAIVGVFADIPIVSNYAFWVLAGAYLLYVAITGPIKKK